MQNTQTEVVIPRELAHKIKNLLMALEDAWKENAAIQHEVSTLAKQLIDAEKTHGTAGTLEELEDAKRLIPKRN